MENEKLWNEMVDMVRESGADLFPREPYYLLACGLVIIAEAVARVAAATKDSEHDDNAAEFRSDALVLLLCLFAQDSATLVYSASTTGSILRRLSDTRDKSAPVIERASSIVYEYSSDARATMGWPAISCLIQIAADLIEIEKARGKSLEAVLQATKDRLETEISLRRIDRLRESVQPLISRDKNNTAP